MTARPKTRAVLILAAALSLFAVPAPPASAADATAALLGRWEAVLRSADGIGQVLEFRADGTMTQWAVVPVDLHYQVMKGSLLITTYRHPGSGATETQAAGLRFEGDTMIQLHPTSFHRTVFTRKRVGRPQDDPIVGVWTTPHESGGTAYLLYTPDGRVVFRLPLKADVGHWTVSADQITMTAGGGTSTVRYAVRSDRLVFDHQGKEIVYIRAELVDY
jgi:hypothetical protein